MQAVAVAEQLHAALASRQLQMVRQAEQMSEAQEVRARVVRQSRYLEMSKSLVRRQEHA